MNRNDLARGLAILDRIRRQLAHDAHYWASALDNYHRRHPNARRAETRLFDIYESIAFLNYHRTTINRSITTGKGVAA